MIRLHNFIHSILLVIITGFISPAAALSPLPAELNTPSLACIDYVYKEKFRQAEAEARKLIKAAPDHPVGYFFYAVALDAWMNFYQVDTKEDEFYQYADQAVEKGERLAQKNQSDIWARFFCGGADGYKGTYESRYQRWITAFRFGWKGVSVLTELQKKEPGLIDALYGVGSYEYWRSVMMKQLYWMPGVEDKRSEGIQKLQGAKERGLYTRLTASAALIPILNNEKRFKEAEMLADEMLLSYPGNVQFTWGKAEAAFGQQKYAIADKLFHDILTRVEIEALDNHYNGVLCHYWLAKIYIAQRRPLLAQQECARIAKYPLSDPIKKRLEKQLNDVSNLRKQAMAVSGGMGK